MRQFIEMSATTCLFSKSKRCWARLKRRRTDIKGTHKINMARDIQSAEAYGKAVSELQDKIYALKMQIVSRFGINPPNASNNRAGEAGSGSLPCWADLPKEKQ